MYKYDNVELMQKLENKYRNIMEEKLQCGTRDLEYREMPSLQDLESYGIYNKAAFSMKL